MKGSYIFVGYLFLGYLLLGYLFVGMRVTSDKAKEAENSATSVISAEGVRVYLEKNRHNLTKMLNDKFNLFEHYETLRIAHRNRVLLKWRRGVEQSFRHYRIMKRTRLMKQILTEKGIDSVEACEAFVNEENEQNGIDYTKYERKEKKRKFVMEVFKYEDQIPKEETSEEP